MNAIDELQLLQSEFDALPTDLSKKLIHMAHPVLAQHMRTAPRSEIQTTYSPDIEQQASLELQNKRVLVLKYSELSEATTPS